MPKTMLRDFAPVRAHLAAGLEGEGSRHVVDDVVARAGRADSFPALAAELKLRELRLAALAMMLAAAGEERWADALALAAFGVEARPPAAIRGFVSRLESAAERPSGPLRDADGRPLVFVVSYPRSGNTRFLNIMAGAFRGSRFTAFFNEGRYVSPQGWGVAFRGPVFVKDHTLSAAYRQNPVIYIARDGRDCMLSYNDFKLRQPAGEAARAEGAESLAWFLAGGAGGKAFGGWPGHIRKALAWRDEGAPLQILRYDEMMGDGAFERIAAVLGAAGVELTAERYAAGLANAVAREEALRSANPTWGRERIYPAGSMMDRWLDTPGATKWRALLGPDEKARLHAAGFTEQLIRAGFEEDPLWHQA